MKVGYEVVCDGNTKVYNMPGLFLEKLEQAGIQEILQAKQSALDNWLNASH